MSARRLLAAAAIATIALLAAPAFAQDVGWRITSFDATYEVAEDGTITVVEDIDVDFGQLERRGIFRNIPVRYEYEPDDRYERVLEIDLVGIEGGRDTPVDVQESTEGANLVWRVGDEDTYISGRHSYRITYRVRGAFNSFASHEEFFWDVTGLEWPVPIERATATVRGPRIVQTACFEGIAGARSACESEDVPRNGRSATFASGALGPAEGLTIVIGFEPGSVTGTDPILDEKFSPARAFAATPATITGASIVGLLALGGVASLLWRQGRDRILYPSAGTAPTAPEADDGARRRLFGGGAVPVQFRPPDDLSPAQLGVVLDERVDPVDVSAAVVDLAVRGHVRIEEIPKKGIFGRMDWRLHRSFNPSDPLRDFEIKLLQGLFGDTTVDRDVRMSSGVITGTSREQSGELAQQIATAESPEALQALLTGADDPRVTQWLAEGHTQQEIAEVLSHPIGSKQSVTMSELKGSFRSDYESVAEMLYNDSVGRGWFRRRPDLVRAMWAGIGVVGLIVAIGITVVLAMFTHAALIGVPLIIAALVLLFGAKHMPHRTVRGSDALSRTLGFREFIATAETGRMQFAEQENLFVKYLPYAVVFGAVDKWANAFSGLDLAAATGGFYYGYAGGFSTGGFSKSMTGFTASAGAGLATSPAASGGSGFSGGGGGSGGGMGGGGGGSW